MQIAQAQLDFSARHTRQQEREVHESLRTWVGDRPPASSTAPAPRDAVALSDAGRAAQSAEAHPSDAGDELRDPRLNLLRRMLEALTGEKIRMFDAEAFMAQRTDSTSSGTIGQTGPATDDRAGYGVAYDRSERYEESETLQFSASGTIQTRDGQTVQFELSFSLERRYVEERNLSIRLGDAARPVDPLIVNFDGNAADLQDTRFRFDLNADGRPDQIATPGAGSAFLVLDRNRDGQVNDGRELFGPSTGNGFTELAALDEDGNGWIDAGDPAFADLAVWRPGAEGQALLQSLPEAGIGALGLSALATPFAYTGHDNALLGELQRTGLLLREDGKVGTMQQVDLTI